MPSIAGRGRCHRSRATDGAIDRAPRTTDDGRHTTTHRRDRGFQDVPTTLILPLSSPTITISSSSCRRRSSSSSSSISRLYGVALSWAVLSLTTINFDTYTQTTIISIIRDYVIMCVICYYVSLLCVVMTITKYYHYHSLL